ncbi:MAG: PKD domain-containing protein, partial [Bacteroidia bacterium]|nr:PKD domain-containing protein [Bacteroidia bacterium]
MPPAPTNTAGPAFRSILPVPNKSRYLPNLSDLVNNVSPTWEVLSSVNRSYNFRFTVRDNYPGSSCTDEENVSVTVASSAGPFIVTYPNTAVTLNALDNATITWDVASTDIAPVNATNVNIMLSTDGGLTYPDTLISNTPNDGSQVVVIPNNQTTTARIMVKAATNVFFDISNTNFTIAAPSNPDYTLSANPLSVEVCAPTSAVYNVNIGQILSYTDPVTLTVSGNPSGSSFSFSTNPVVPPGTSTLTISNTGSVTPGTYNFTLFSTSTSGVKNVDLELVVFGGVPPTASLTSPADGATAVPYSTTFMWTGSSSNTYRIEISTDSTFSTLFLVDSTVNATSFNNSIEFSPSTKYFWRVRGSNFCGVGSWSATSCFTTESCPVISFPLVEDAESLLTCESNCVSAGGCNSTSNGWINMQSGDDTDWSISQGGTPSTGTGPSVDHTLGTTAGTYYYTEATSPCNASSQEAHLVRECVDLNSLVNPVLSFWYHMYGPSMGILNVDINHNGVWINAYWSISGQQQTSNGDAWTNQEINLASFLSTGGIVDIRFRGVIGSGFESDMAIDDISIFDSNTPPTADFSANTLSTCTGINVQLTDISGQSPTAWTWTISPGTFTFENGTNANSQNPEISFTAAGDYTIQLAVDNAFGSDTILKSNYISINNGVSLPMIEDFQSGAIPPAGWSIENGDGGTTWSTSGLINGSSGASTLAAYMNNYNYNAPGQEDGILSLNIDLTAVNSATLSFDVAYVKYSSTLFDGLRIDVSTDCGETFNPSTYFKEGTSLETAPTQTSIWAPSGAADWRNDTLDLSSYTGGSIILKFVNINGYGNSLFIDNVNVDGSLVCNNPTISNVSVMNVTCFGDENGSIDITVAGGTPPYTYVWSNSSTTQDISSLGPGTYSVIVSDNEGCTAQASEVITQPATIGITSSKNNVSCNGVNNGTANVSVSGGVAPYAYSWNTNPVKTTAA